MYSILTPFKAKYDKDLENCRWVTEHADSFSEALSEARYLLNFSTNHAILMASANPKSTQWWSVYSKGMVGYL